MPLREAFPRGEVPLCKGAEPPGGIRLLEEKLSFREAQLQEVVALWKEITRPGETLPPREIEPPREVEPPREIEPPREVEPPREIEPLREIGLPSEIGPPRGTWPPEGSTPPEGSEPLRGTASHQEVKPPGERGPPGEVELSGRAVPPRGPLSAGGVAQQGELGQPRGVLPPELESPVEGMSQPTTAPQPVEETQPGGGSTLLEPPPPQAGEGRQPRPPSPPPLPRPTECRGDGREEGRETEEEPLVHRHLGEENEGRMPLPLVTARREPKEKGGAYTKVSGSQGEASVLAEATSGRLQPDEWELLPPPPPLGRGAHPELEEQARQTQGMEKRGSRAGVWEAAKEERDQCLPRGGPGHTKGESPPPLPEEKVLAPK